MKFLKVGILIYLICHGSLGLSLPLQWFSGSCCSDTTELSTCHSPDDNNDTEKKGCCGSGCDCFCCGHVFVLSPIEWLQEPTTKPTNPMTIDYSFNYIHSFHTLIWQPPRIDC